MENLINKVESCQGKARVFADEILSKAKDGTLTIGWITSQQGKWLFAGCVSHDLVEVKRAAIEMLQGGAK
jgi:hypothetical protein